MKIIALLLLLSGTSFAASQIKENTFSRPKSWMLSSYIVLAEKHPQKLLDLASEQFSPEALRRARVERSLSFAWQDRMALLGGLSQLFNPEARIKASRIEIKSYQKTAKSLIEGTLNGDTSLIVRDGAVETIRRIIRMQPENSKIWKNVLEAAFLDRKNILDGEGLFIRETLLTALREANLPLTGRVKRAAELDQNPKVKNLLSLWNTRAFDTL